MRKWEIGKTEMGKSEIWNRKVRNCENKISEMRNMKMSEKWEEDKMSRHCPVAEGGKGNTETKKTRKWEIRKYEIWNRK